jgi:hypothetical protein
MKAETLSSKNENFGWWQSESCALAAELKTTHGNGKNQLQA